ncbi:MAG: hypothetical protein R3C53_24805 [Pirellulaceae bacterium]
MSAGSPVWPAGSGSNETSLSERLRPFRWRAIQVGGARLALLAIGLFAIALVGAMWLDIIWELPTAVRWFITRPGIVFATLGTTIAIWWRSRQWTDDRLAHHIDTTQNTGGEILAGWQLATRPIQPAGELSRSLAAVAANRASQRVSSIAPSTVIDAATVKKAGVFALWVLLVCGLLWLVIPGIVTHQLSRFLFPNNDIPPYTGLFLTLELERSSVLYGQDVMVAASVSDKVERVTLSTRRGDGSEQTIPMLSQGDNMWQAILTRVTEPLVLVAHSGSSRSKALQLDVQMTPQILPPRVTISPPAYTRAAVYAGILPEKGLIGLAGTRVEWEVSSNRPLSSGRLLLNFEDGTSQQLTLQPLTSENARDAANPIATNQGAGTLVLERAGRFELSVVDIDGIESHEKIQGSITITQDARPIVRITQPRPISLATPDINLPVTVVAEDDYGITALSLYRSLNGSPASRIDAELDHSARQQAVWTLPLPKFGLSPGDEIHLFARTEDNDPAGIKGAESPVTIVRIISVAQFQEMMIQQRGAESLQAKYQAARRHFDQLASALKDVEEAAREAAANPDSTEAAENLQQKLAAAEQIAQEASESIEKLSQQAMPIDVDQELSKRLGEMAKQAADMAQQLGDMQQPANEPASDEQPAGKSQLTESEMQQLQEMLKAAAGAQEELTEQAIQPMQQMQKMMPLIVAQQQFTQLTQQQRDLANRLNSLAEKEDLDDPATQRRVAELEAEQEQLRQSLEQLLDNIEAGAAELPDDPELQQLKQTALEFAEAVRSSAASDEMTAAQQHLLGTEFADAQQKAAAAADILESFLSQNDQMGGEACENCQAAFKPGAGGPQLGNSIQQMLAMMGMKPGASPGGKPGMGPGWGAGGGFAQRFPGQQNMGMYGSIPNPRSSQRSGRGEMSAGGVASNHDAQAPAANAARGDRTQSGNASGQSMNSIPAQYRSQVAEYFRTLNDALGEAED